MHIKISSIILTNLFNITLLRSPMVNDKKPVIKSLGQFIVNVMISCISCTVFGFINLTFMVDRKMSAVSLLLGMAISCIFTFFMNYMYGYMRRWGEAEDTFFRSVVGKLTNLYAFIYAAFVTFTLGAFITTFAGTNISGTIVLILITIINLIENDLFKTSLSIYNLFSYAVSTSLFLTIIFNVEITEKNVLLQSNISNFSIHDTLYSAALFGLVNFGCGFLNYYSPGTPSKTFNLTNVHMLTTIIFSITNMIILYLLIAIDFNKSTNILEQLVSKSELFQDIDPSVISRALFIMVYFSSCLGFASIMKKFVIKLISGYYNIPKEELSSPDSEIDANSNTNETSPLAIQSVSNEEITVEMPSQKNKKISLNERIKDHFIRHSNSYRENLTVLCFHLASILFYNTGLSIKYGTSFTYFCIYAHYITCLVVIMIHLVKKDDSNKKITLKIFRICWWKSLLVLLNLIFLGYLLFYKSSDQETTQKVVSVPNENVTIAVSSPIST